MSDVSLTQRDLADDATDVAASGSAGASAAEPRVRKGLTYPLGDWHPDAGELYEIADGVHWLRMPMPFSLNHINLWILDGGDSWTIVDSAIPAKLCKDVWRGVLNELTAIKPVGQMLCTHYHPDHIGNAGWIVKKTGATLVMTLGEYLMARMLLGDVRDEPPEDAVRYFEKAGWPDEALTRFREQGWGRFSKVVSHFPTQYRRIRDGETIKIGARDWRIVVGSGHTPEHACLVDDADGLMIAGDQVLPRITSNVSVHGTEPMADPLGDWLASIEKLRALPEDLFVLPAHGFPFTGLHTRLDQLAADHENKLMLLQGFLSKPRTAFDSFEILFSRPIDENEFGIATGEAMAHLRWLEKRGKARRDVRKNRADMWTAT
ncbi:MAG: MBL fold metallo-hydrolase [Pacificimonas sp.]